MDTASSAVVNICILFPLLWVRFNDLLQFYEEIQQLHWSRRRVSFSRAITCSIYVYIHINSLCKQLTVNSSIWRAVLWSKEPQIPRRPKPEGHRLCGSGLKAAGWLYCYWGVSTAFVVWPQLFARCSFKVSTRNTRRTHILSFQGYRKKILELFGANTV